MSAPTTTENLTWLESRWAGLTATRLRGTPRPWRQATLTPEQRAHLDAQARAEKLEHGAFVLGESPAPIHLDTLDHMDTLVQTITVLAQELAHDLGHDAIAQKALTHRYSHPLLLLEYLRNHHLDATEETQARIHAETAQLRRTIAAHLSEITDGQHLAADCPWCHHDKLYLRLIGPEHNRQPVIRCESGACEPPESDCGTWHHNNPTWPFHEWEWLANIINHQEARTA